MNKIIFNGKEYVRVSVAAKKFRYTQDYVGQLCRDKKVSARRVGRVWFVDLDSVSEYRKNKHQTQKESVATSKVVSKKTPRSRATKAVEPVLRSKTARLSQSKIKATQEIFNSKKPSHEESTISVVSDTPGSYKLEPAIEETKKNTKSRKKVRVQKKSSVKIPLDQKDQTVKISDKRFSRSKNLTKKETKAIGDVPGKQSSGTNNKKMRNEFGVRLVAMLLIFLSILTSLLLVMIKSEVSVVNGVQKSTLDFIDLKSNFRR